ncbi:hypothetical protein [Stenotrophomonas sp.]|uniref:hypothetical protein n=1 Tax=Stenotrophomonas sp. TaxID=69392 RepID=UPI0028ADA1C3|nr:hypothetical protein [Stenotrophomonas sp.]
MSKVDQTEEELERHLSDSVYFLKASSAAFDGGFFGEAKRLATTLRVLVHDTGKSQSLLGLMGKKEELAYFNTAKAYNPNNLLAHHGLVGFCFVPEGIRYFAPLGDHPPSRQRSKSSFSEWWDEKVIVDNAGGAFTRKDLVLALANKDGGAHVDPKLDAAYAKLTRSNSLGWVASDTSGESPLMDVELHSVRQIAHELLQTLTDSELAAP